MKNGMPLYVLSAGNEDVIRFDLLVRSGQLDQSQPLQPCLPTVCCVRERCA